MDKKAIRKAYDEITTIRTGDSRLVVDIMIYQQLKRIADIMENNNGL